MAFCVGVRTFTWSDTVASCCWSVRLRRVEVLSRAEKAEVTRLEAVGDSELMWPPLVRTDWPLSSPQPLIYTQATSGGQYFILFELFASSGDFN